MARTLLITLTTAGVDTGPFNLLSNTDGFTVPFESNISKGDLESGYVSSLIPDVASIIRVQSNNPLCNTYIDLIVPESTTTTTTTSTPVTTTTTTTEEPVTTTTTTTVLVKPTFSITNNTTGSVNASLLIFEIDGGTSLYTITSGSLPLTPGNTLTGEIVTPGTYDMLFSGSKINSSEMRVSIIDSSINPHCEDANSGTGSTFSLSVINVACNNSLPGIDISITLEDNICP